MNGQLNSADFGLKMLPHCELNTTSIGYSNILIEINDQLIIKRLRKVSFWKFLTTPSTEFIENLRYF